jgi:hypothetical protein
MTVSHGKSSLKMKDCYESGANNDVGMTREENDFAWNVKNQEERPP